MPAAAPPKVEFTAKPGAVVVKNAQGDSIAGPPAPLGVAAPGCAADEERRGRAEALFRRPASFLKGVVRVDDLPPPAALEVAFAGRSNVGKSSLINALLGRKGLARTSDTPGRTREINFYRLGTGIHIVDLPGYGYAKAPKSQIKGWNDLIAAYLKGRPSLQRVFLLIDSRHGLKDNDRAIVALMDQAAVSYQAVLTKIDKLKAGAAERTAAAVMRELAARPAAHPELIATSAVKGHGLVELRVAIAELALAAGEMDRGGRPG